MISIAEGTARTVWFPVNGTDTVYVGQLVYMGKDTNDQVGVIMTGPAVGVHDTTNPRTPLGVVVGTNNRTPLYSSTYKTEYITGVVTMAAQVARLPEAQFGARGMWAVGDPQPMVEVALIDSTTYLKADIWSSATAMTPLTTLTSTASSTGTQYTSNAMEFTPVAYNATHYCISGSNAGLYRISSSTSTTVHDFAGRLWPYTIGATGDTFRAANVCIGKCYMQLSTLSMWIDNTAAVSTTNNFKVDVIKVDLREADQAYAIFKFDGDHFCTVRA